MQSCIEFQMKAPELMNEFQNVSVFVLGLNLILETLNES